jgi:general secretion pathway protein N
VTRRRIVLYCVVGGVAYLAALIGTFPASWVSRALERASAQKLLLRAPEGSIWAGSGRLYAHERSGPPLELGELRWKTAWLAIFAGKLAADVRFGAVGRTAHLELSPSRVTVQGLDVTLPGRILANFAPGLDTVGPQGTLRIRSDGLRINADSILGIAEIEWRQVRLTRAPGLDLGSHVARLRGAGGRVDIELGTLEGPLQLTGKGTWDRNAGLTMAGSAEHGPQAAAELGAFLKAVCTEYRNNRCAFRFRP